MLFGKRCGSCHTAGEGDRVGPDLLNVGKRRERAWIAGFVRAPGAAIDRGDPVAGELIKKFNNVRMPDQAITDEELAGVLGWLEACAVKGGCKIVTGKTKPVSQATEQDLTQGRALFEGRLALTGGGPACISCHNLRGVGLLGGGTLAKDLTFAFARLGEQGINGALEGTPFPLMKDVFAGRALSAAEVFSLKALFAAVSRDGSQPMPDHDFFYLGVMGLFASLAGFGIVWSRRIQGSRGSALLRRERS